MTKRGDEIPRPQPWIVRAVDRQAAKGWDELAGQVLAAVDRAWVAITSDPRRVDSRQHRLKGRLGTSIVLGQPMEQWQFEVTSGGRIWYAIDDQKRTLWLTRRHRSSKADGPLISRSRRVSISRHRLGLLGVPG